MKTDSNRPPTASGNGNHGRSSSLGQQGDAGQQGRPQRVSSATYFDIANTILGSAGDLDEVLLCAARDGDYNRIEQLLCQRRDIIVDVDYKDKRTGNTALIWAAKKGHTKLFERLSSQLNKHYNPVEVAQELMKARANVHAMDNDGKTCLHYAAQARAGVAEKLVETFIGGGSEPDDRGLTPVDLAKTRKMKTTLKEAWTEATQKKQTTELAPVRNPSRDGSRLSKRDASPEKKKGEVIFDILPPTPNFLNHRPYATPEGALVKAMREEDSSKEPSPRSDEEGDNKTSCLQSNSFEFSFKHNWGWSLTVSAFHPPQKIRGP
nr:hypothetical protein BaRGS_014714 [Batillaria attramentaria]